MISGVTMKVNASSDARKELLEAAWRRTESKLPSSIHIQRANTGKGRI